ncbi:pyridoxal phosphate-dependent aminotransferase [Lichenibacterium dinghuense]|uniref:pyridoxal phosphate-dependent aminotransferase n=1 Tax=Lichenibacterium dinghuense TaxID=2895977 RepID=UPI001F22F654|nr:pyridoxal phosphate-dependent aminotransferase [Lichenibacterium sp. 6Y81]
MSAPADTGEAAARAGGGAGSFPLADFLSRWADCAIQDLAASDSQTLHLSTLLRYAGTEDLRRWHGVGLGYADPRGAPWLRAAIAGRYEALGDGGVLACNGAQEAIACVLRAVLRPVDHAVVVVPIYGPSELAVTGLCAASGVALDPDRGWSLDLDRVAAAIRPNTRLVVANFPNSPTGASLGPATLGGLVALCRRHGLWLVNDEVYGQTDAGGGAPAVADIYEKGVSINGLSKGFGLPGLRVGWAACRDKGLLDRAIAQKSLLSSCLSGPSEVLAHVALEMEARITALARSIGRRNHRRLRALLDRFPDLFEADLPANLAFAFPRFRGAEGAARFADTLARQAGLLVAPSTLWRSPLAQVPDDRLRIGLGRLGSGPALAALEAHLLRLTSSRGSAACTG